MGRLSVLTTSGDKSIEWNTQKVREGDPEAARAVREAERLFNEERARGSTAFKLKSGQTAQRIDEFEESAEQIIIVPRVAGG